MHKYSLCYTVTRYPFCLAVISSLAHSKILADFSVKYGSSKYVLFNPKEVAKISRCCPITTFYQLLQVTDDTLNNLMRSVSNPGICSLFRCVLDVCTLRVVAVYKQIILILRLFESCIHLPHFSSCSIHY